MKKLDDVFVQCSSIEHPKKATPISCSNHTQLIEEGIRNKRIIKEQVVHTKAERELRKEIKANGVKFTNSLITPKVHKQVEGKFIIYVKGNKNINTTHSRIGTISDLATLIGKFQKFTKIKKVYFNNELVWKS